MGVLRQMQATQRSAILIRMSLRLHCLPCKGSALQVCYVELVAGAHYSR